MAAHPEAPAFSLAQYMAQETQLFYAHLKEAAEKFEDDGTVPSSLFGAKAIRALKKAGGRRKGAADGPKRKPTAFNLFIKEKMEGLAKKPDAKEIPYKQKFKDVVAMWSALSDAEKKKYADKYADQTGHAPVASPVKRPAVSSDDESTEDEAPKSAKKKKKGKHHKH